jgi:hypothetical protein
VLWREASEGIAKMPDFAIQRPFKIRFAGPYFF